MSLVVRLTYADCLVSYLERWLRCRPVRKEYGDARMGAHGPYEECLFDVSFEWRLVVGLRLVVRLRMVVGSLLCSSFLRTRWNYVLVEEIVLIEDYNMSVIGKRPVYNPCTVSTSKLLCVPPWRLYFPSVRVCVLLVGFFDHGHGKGLIIFVLISLFYSRIFQVVSEAGRTYIL